MPTVVLHARNTHEKNSKVILVKVNVDRCQEFTQYINVNSIPCLVMVKDNQVIDVLGGRSFSSKGIIDFFSKASEQTA